MTERPSPLDRLYREFAPALKAHGLEYEFLFLVEPWAHEMTRALAPLRDQGEPIRVFETGQTMGEAALLTGALPLLDGSIVLTLPAYPRIEADGLRQLIEAVQGGCDLATARRVSESDSMLNRVQKRLFHSILGTWVGGSFTDIASGVRAMRREVLQDVPVYGDFFRFLPVLAEREGFRVREIPLAQHPEDTRTRIYSPGIYLRRLIDLLGLFFVVRFTRKPLRFFGLVGTGVSGIGAVILVILFVQRLGGQGIADRPLLLLGVLLFVVGVQAIAIGLVGEIIVHLNAAARPQYRIREQRSVRAESHGDSDT